VKTKSIRNQGLVLFITLVTACSEKADRSDEHAINSSATVASSNDTLRVNQPRAFAQSGAIAADGTNILAEPAGTAASGADNALAARLKTGFQSDPQLLSQADRVQVTSKNGQIVLSGTVETEAQKQSFFDKAREMAGEAKVENNLQVQSTTDSTPNEQTQKPQNP
jgi:osmotically-inducible protein OsmY